jgi:hypothetical protein
MKKISIAVMAHPSRSEFFPYLLRKLGDVKFSIDDGCGIWENRKRATMMYDPAADFHLVIQDDAIICDNFKELAEKTVNREKEYAYSFYFGNRQAYRKAAQDGMSRGFIIADWMSWGVAICLPTRIIPEAMAYCDKMTGHHDDSRIGRYLKHKGIKIYFPMPSLVDHRPHGNSLVNDPAKGRKAWYFIDNIKK